MKENIQQPRDGLLGRFGAHAAQIPHGKRALEHGQQDSGCLGGIQRAKEALIAAALDGLRELGEGFRGMALEEVQELLQALRVEGGELDRVETAGREGEKGRLAVQPRRETRPQVEVPAPVDYAHVVAGVFRHHAQP